MGQGGTHLGDAEDEAEIHDGNDDGGQCEAAPAAGKQAEIPAGIVAGDNRADAQRPQRSDTGVAAQAALVEVVLVDRPVVDAGFVHAALPRSALLYGTEEGRGEKFKSRGSIHES